MKFSRAQFLLLAYFYCAAAIGSEPVVSWANLQYPPELTQDVGIESDLVYGQVYAAGFTDALNDPVPGIIAQVGYGPADVNPATDLCQWRWFDMAPNPAYDFSANNDEHYGRLIAEMPGDYLFTTRWSTDGGAGWLVTDFDGPPYEAENAGVLTVTGGTNRIFEDGFERGVCAGSIILAKTTIPGSSTQNFPFTGDLSGSIQDTQTLEVHDVVAGTYSATEGPVAGWDLTQISCDDQASAVPSTGDIGAATATFHVEPGETVTCVFTNTQRGSIEVVKSLSATGPPIELFNFNSNFIGSFQLQGNQATTGPIEVLPDSGYSVSEVDPTDIGWYNTGAACTSGDNPAIGITVSPGEHVVCTFTNTPIGG